MMIFATLKILLLISTFLYVGKAVDVQAIAFSMNSGDLIYHPIVNDFNKFAKENNLNITIKLNLFSLDNATTSVRDYETMLDSLFNKKSDKYDLIYFDNIYTSRFGPDLLDLRDLLPKEHIDMYIEGIANQTCFYEDKLVGLPTTIDYTVLYQSDLLEKYNKTSPKTWDELIEIGEYIQKEENKDNLMIYNGIFSDNEMGLCSLYEFIYTFRDSVDSPFPKITSNNAIKALEKMKEIKERISSDIIFRSDEFLTYTMMMNNNFLFVKNWYLPYIPYKYTILPGSKVGISGATIGGHNLGINKYSDQEKRKEVIKAFEYLTSKYIQKKYVAMDNYYSAIPSLYNDEEVCSVVDCEYYKSIQLIGRPVTKDYVEYTNYFKKYIYEFLYGNSTAIEVLKKVEGLNKVYHYSISTEDSPIGLINLILVVVLSIIMVSSLILIFKTKFKPFFENFTTDLWLIYILGLVLIIYTYFTEIGPNSPIKCHLRALFFSLGFTLNVLPIIYKLVICFPEKDNKVSIWVLNHKWKFMTCFCLIDILLNLLLLTSPYTLEDYTRNMELKNYKVCTFSNVFGKILVNVMIAYKIITYLSVIVLVFLEWNLKSIHFDNTLITYTLYINSVFLIILTVLINFVRFENYIYFYAIRQFICFFYALSNYLIFFGVRILKALIRKKDNDYTISGSLSKSLNKSDNVSRGNNSIMNSFSCKIIDYHYKT